MYFHGLSCAKKIIKHSPLPAIIFPLRLAENSQRFRVEDVPPRLHEKERISGAFRDIERFLQDNSGERLDRELHPEALDRNWNQLMMLYQVRNDIQITTTCLDYDMECILCI